MRWVWVVIFAGCASGTTDEIDQPIPPEVPPQVQETPEKEKTVLHCTVLKRTQVKSCVLYELDCGLDHREFALFCDIIPGAYIPEDIPEPYRR